MLDTSVNIGPQRVTDNQKKDSKDLLTLLDIIHNPAVKTT
jgi:hypothetical protein